MYRANVELFPEHTVAQRLERTTGILPSQSIQGLVATGRIRSTSAITEEQIQPASIDLRLGRVAYRVQASFLPGTKSTVERKIKELLISEIDLTRPTVLEKGCVFIVPL